MPDNINLREPPTELEVADLLRVQQTFWYASIVRRLLFQREQQKAETKRLRTKLEAAKWWIAHPGAVVWGWREAVGYGYFIGDQFAGYDKDDVIDYLTTNHASEEL